MRGQSHRSFAAWGWLTLALFGLSGCAPHVDRERHGAPQEVMARVLTIAATEGDETFEATGNVRARLNAVLSSKLMARVARVHVREGDRVRAGQTLLELDPRESAAAVDVAGANLRAAQVGLENASTAAQMERGTSTARVAEAEAQVRVSQATYSAAQSKLDLALAGPRTQEREQARLAVAQAESNVTFASSELDRQTRLLEAGAVSRRDKEAAQNAFDVATAQYNSAVQSERIAAEGTREQEVRTARDAVDQARALLRQSEAALQRAKAESMSIEVRRREVESARAQVSQSGAALRSAQVGRSYAVVTAPFDGVVVKRSVDPGAMATPGLPLLEIEGGGLRIEAQVPESIVTHLAQGSRVVASVDSLGAETLTGTVAELVPQGDVSTHTFVAKVALPDRSGLKSGFFGRIEIPVGRRTAVRVPRTALTERDGLVSLFVVDSHGTARLRFVKTGRTSGGLTEVLSGLSSGERIVVHEAQGVRDGTPIRETP